MKSLSFKTVVCSLWNVIIGLSNKIACFFSGKELMLGFAFNLYGGKPIRDVDKPVYRTSATLRRESSIDYNRFESHH